MRTFIDILCVIMSVLSLLIVLACVGRIREIGRELNLVKTNYDMFLKSFESYNNALIQMEQDFDDYKDKQAQKDIRFNNDLVVRVKNLEGIIVKDK